MYKMKQEFDQIGFDVEFTKDGSPTLRLQQADAPEGSKRPESMHHSAGAASETKYIYQNVISKVISIYQSGKTDLKDLKMCSVGLGLGYIEMALAIEVINQQLEVSLCKLDSFEIREELRNFYEDWLLNNPRDSRECYDLVLESLSHKETDKQKVKSILLSIISKHPLQKDLLDIEKYKVKPAWNLVCYDAFSSHTNSMLWSEGFLKKLLNEYCSPDCVFTTYACTATLKKELQASGFLFIKRPGYSGKRDSTLALRGVFTSDLDFFQTF